MTAFATSEDLATLLGIVDPDETWTAQADLFLDLIGADIEAAAGAKIVAGSGTLLLAGSWSQDLELPNRPISSVGAVLLNGVAVGSSEFSWNERSLLRKGAAMFGVVDDFDFVEDWNALGMQGAGWSTGGHWGGPSSTVAVTYAWGYAAEDVPPVLRSLSLRVASRVIGNPTGVSSEQLGVYSVQYGKAGAGDGSSYLNMHETRMLRKKFGTTGGTFNPQPMAVR
jgi:hypothetical protein